MNTQSDQVLKVYSTERGAVNFKNKFYANDEDVKVAFVADAYMVIAVYNW